LAKKRPGDFKELAFTLHKAVWQSGLGQDTSYGRMVTASLFGVIQDAVVISPSG